MKLGQRLKCTVTGFTGIAIAKVEYLQGKTQFGIQPKVGPDGKYPEVQWINENLLEVFEEIPTPF